MRPGVGISRSEECSTARWPQCGHGKQASIRGGGGHAGVGSNACYPPHCCCNSVPSAARHRFPPTTLPCLDFRLDSADGFGLGRASVSAALPLQRCETGLTGPACGREKGSGGPPHKESAGPSPQVERTGWAVFADAANSPTGQAFASVSIEHPAPRRGSRCVDYAGEGGG